MRFLQVVCGVLVVMALCGASPVKKYHRSIPRGYMIGGSYYTSPRFARQGYEYIPPGAMTAMVIGDTVATNSFAGSPGQVLSVPLDDAAPEIEGDQSPEQVAEPFSGGAPEPESLNETEPQADLPQDQGNNVDDQEVLFSLESGTTETIVLSNAEPSYDPAAGLPAEAPAEELAPAAEDAAPEGFAPPAPAPVPAPSPALAAPAPAPAAPAPAAPVAPAAAPVAPAAAPAGGAPARKNKASKGRKPAVPTPAPADDDDDDSGALPASWPFGNAGKGVPSYNAFFPIFIGGKSPSGRARTRSANGDEGNYPGSATAIANSFSTGKGGVATSHATSFGDPYAAAALRNAGLFNSKFEA
ncbi:hypothetical protein GWI33_008090 [Rhynchophorus ferrugineus]|uniref:Uncharacterized protein n=1 Tax=Rhynchophorus ferrugineus TaxID=354439 RepID=A0A834MHQ5_RHYFE|nr:hypothetical protein GWI33_008090 [Rhynchophorus ferrugineus]